MGEATSTTAARSRFSVTATGVHCIYGSGYCCWEGSGALPGSLAKVILCHGSLMAFSLIESSHKPNLLVLPLPISRQQNILLHTFIQHWLYLHLSSNKVSFVYRSVIDSFSCWWKLARVYSLCLLKLDVCLKEPMKASHTQSGCSYLLLLGL